MEQVSTWTPLRVAVFRALWIAVLVSNIGTWMQTVGAQWLLVGLPHAAILVALVQTADFLPDALFGIVGGVLADIFDRRRLLIVVQTGLGAVAVALAALTYVGQMPPALLLTFTFVIGTSSVFTNPAFQSLLPEIVPRKQLRAASALGSISINLARLVGPALAGVIIAQLGAAAVFGLNAATYFFFAVVVALWRPRSTTTPDLPERFLSATRAGTRYVRHAPIVRRILLRATLFLIPASVLWALLPLIATQRLHLQASGYGLLLGVLGAGAIAGALLVPRAAARLSTNATVAAASLVYAAALVLIVAVPSYAFVVVVLLPAGAAWLAVLANVNAELQLFLPAWVRARGLSIYQMVLFGSQGAGAVVWGFLAEPFGIVGAFLIAAAVLLASTVTVRWWPLIATAGMDRSTAVRWPEPHLVFEPSQDDGPVVVQTVYAIAPSAEREFFDAMKKVRQSRLRTGASQWGLFRDGEYEHRFVELFVVPSWEEHLRQHRNRQTGTDREYEEVADRLSDPPPKTTHLIGADDR